MAVVQVIENGGARLEVNKSGSIAQLRILEPEPMKADAAIALDADDLKALIKRCKVVLAQLEG